MTGLRARLDNDLKLEELGENENSKLDLDKTGYSKTCTGRLRTAFQRSWGQQDIISGLQGVL
eukprot:4005842-Heterocapsa_arctica.AAC.1